MFGALGALNSIVICFLGREQGTYKEFYRLDADKCGTRETT